MYDRYKIAQVPRYLPNRPRFGGSTRKTQVGGRTERPVAARRRRRARHGWRSRNPAPRGGCLPETGIARRMKQAGLLLAASSLTASRRVGQKTVGFTAQSGSTPLPQPPAVIRGGRRSPPCVSPERSSRLVRGNSCTARLRVWERLVGPEVGAATWGMLMRSRAIATPLAHARNCVHARPEDCRS